MTKEQISTLFERDRSVISRHINNIYKEGELDKKTSVHFLHICDSNPNYRPPELSDLPYKGDTIVGNDVWIGENATILPGVHIGDGAIIGANSVVSKDIPPYSICVGNPCVVKKYRFDDEMIQLLEELKWWDKGVEEIKELIPLLSNSDINYVKEELKKCTNS